MRGLEGESGRNGWFVSYEAGECWIAHRFTLPRLVLTMNGDSVPDDHVRP
jgi:hypothetical protein